MKGKKGMTQEMLVKMIIGLILLSILIYFAYTYVLGGGKSAVALGQCEAKPEQTCMGKDGSCDGQLLKFGCKGNSKGEYCCIPEKART